MESSRNPPVVHRLAHRGWGAIWGCSLTGSCPHRPQLDPLTPPRSCRPATLPDRPCGFLEESVWSPRGIHLVATTLPPRVNNRVNPVEQLEDYSRMELGQLRASTAAPGSSSRHPTAIPMPTCALTCGFGRSPQIPQCLLLLQFYFLKRSLQKKVCGKSVGQARLGRCFTHKRQGGEGVGSAALDRQGGSMRTSRDARVPFGCRLVVRDSVRGRRSTSTPLNTPAHGFETRRGQIGPWSLRT